MRWVDRVEPHTAEPREKPSAVEKASATRALATRRQGQASVKATSWTLTEWVDRVIVCLLVCPQPATVLQSFQIIYLLIKIKIAYFN